MLVNSTYWDLKYRFVGSTRAIHWCSRCRAEMHIGESCIYRVYVTNPDREFHTEYQCFLCDTRQR